MRIIASLTVISVFVAGCNGSPSEPSISLSPIPPVSGSPSPPNAPALDRFHVSGIVTDDTGPLAGAGVQIYYSDSPAPRGTCCGWPKAVETVTNNQGRYDLELPLAAAPYEAVVGAGTAGYNSDEQLVPLAEGVLDVTVNLRPRRMRTAALGETVEMVVEPDSAICIDFDDLITTTTRCSWLLIDGEGARKLDVDLRSMPGGDSGRIISLRWTANLFRVAVSVPAYITEPQRFLVTARPGM